MKRSTIAILAVLVVGIALSGCAQATTVFGIRDGEVVEVFGDF
ncbi:hypothetical protein BH24CHL6_BH24CHL6_08160 [soil metagenome]